MGLPASGAISFANLRSEYSDGGSTSLSEFYRGGSNVRSNFGYNNNTGIPTSGTIDLGDFYNNYYEGTTLQKLEDFRAVKNSGAIWVSLEGSPGGQLMTSDDSGANNPNSRYQNSDDCPNNTTRSSQHTSSQWTTVIGVAAVPYSSAATRSSPLSISGGVSYSLVYNSTSNTNTVCCAIQANVPHNTIGNVSHTFTRNAGNRWAGGMCIVMPGKWSYNRVGTKSNSQTLASGEILLYARERGGDGYSQTRYTSSASNTTCTHRYGWWYNTGSVGIATNGNSSSQNFSLTGEAPNGAWVFTESG
jgi:hypothetical protein